MSQPSDFLDPRGQEIAVQASGASVPGLPVQRRLSGAERQRAAIFPGLLPLESGGRDTPGAVKLDGAGDFPK